MNRWKIKFLALKAKSLERRLYFIYRIRSKIGIRTKGYKKEYGLIIISLLEKYKLPEHSMSVSRTDQDLNTSDVFKLHKSGIRLDPKSHISIIINTELRQSEIYVGQFLKKYVSDNRSQEIEKQIQLKMNENEIILAMEIGMRKVCESFK